MSKRKLLLADDSITIQKVVNLTFADEGVEVITVGDGDAAVEKIAEVSPDLVLADVHMPGLNGYQICEWIRANPVTKELPVILLVGSFEPFDETEAARVGANAYLTKPFQSIRQLVSQVTNLMESSPQAEVNGHPHVEVEPAAEHGEAPVSDDAIAASGIGDTNDIDSLYHQSFGEPVSEERETSAAPFVDAGMDDEMIETSYTAEVDSTTDSSFNEDRSSYGNAVDSEEGAPEPAYTVEEPASFREMGPTDASYSYDEGRPAAGDARYDEPITSDARTTAEFPRDENISQSAGFSGPVGAVADQHTYVDQYAATEQIQQTSEDEPTQSFELDEAELLELPPLDSEKTIEFKTPRELVAEEARKEVVTLSPELLDTIVAKVVEKLSKDN